MLSHFVTQSLKIGKNLALENVIFYSTEPLKLIEMFVFFSNSSKQSPPSKNCNLGYAPVKGLFWYIANRCFAEDFSR